MSSSVVEEMRQLHEDVERNRRLAVRDLLQGARTQRQTVQQSHRVKRALETERATASKLARLYKDEDGAVAKELEDVKASGNAVFTTFYERLRAVRTYHARFPSATALDVAEGDEDAWARWTDEAANVIDFSGEESYGRYLDLHRLHGAFNNLRQFETVEYLEYVSLLPNFARFPRTKKDREYREYLDALLEYLCSFMQRTQPMVDLEDILASCDCAFEQAWAAGKVIGWTLVDGKDDAAPVGEADVKQSKLFCEPCDRLFANQGAFDGHLPGKKHKRAVTRAKVHAEAEDGGDADKVAASAPAAAAPVHSLTFARETARIEARISRICELLSEVLENTKAFIESKQARTAAELEAEFLALEEAELRAAEESDSDDENKPLYNPLNLPLGWDGKPIPFWLYKLQGLNHEFRCEICGNYSYFGRRDYERHFQEWRHQYGMRCLGIPNTRHFHEITSIQDALELHKKLVAEQSKSQWNSREDEEFEDMHGNVFNRKVMEDLQRQGINVTGAK